MMELQLTIYDPDWGFRASRIVLFTRAILDDPPALEAWAREFLPDTIKRMAEQAKATD